MARSEQEAREVVAELMGRVATNVTGVVTALKAMTKGPDEAVLTLMTAARVILRVHDLAPLDHFWELSEEAAKLLDYVEVEVAPAAKEDRS